MAGAAVDREPSDRLRQHFGTVYGLGHNLNAAATTAATGATLLSALTDIVARAQAIATSTTPSPSTARPSPSPPARRLARPAPPARWRINTSPDHVARQRSTRLQGNTTNASSVAGGQIQLNTGLAADLDVTGSAGVLTVLGLDPGHQITATRTGGVTSTPGITAATLLSGSAIPGGADALVSGFTARDYLVVNNKTITFHSGGGNTGSIATNDLSIDITTATVGTLTAAIDLATGGSSTSAGSIDLTTSTTADISFTGSTAGTLAKLGLTGPINRNTAGGPVALTGATLLSGAASTSSNSLTTAFAAGDTITVNGQNITFQASGASGNNQVNITDNVTQLLGKIDALSGSAPLSAVVGGVVTLHTGTTSDLSISSSNAAALAGLGFAGPVAQARGTGRLAAQRPVAHHRLDRRRHCDQLHLRHRRRPG